MAARLSGFRRIVNGAFRSSDSQSTLPIRGLLPLMRYCDNQYFTCHFLVDDTKRKALHQPAPCVP